MELCTLDGTVLSYVYNASTTLHPLIHPGIVTKVDEAFLSPEGLND